MGTAARSQLPPALDSHPLCGCRMTEQYDVIIVGSGPTGGAAANIAGRHGLKCLLVDETEEAFPLPRAVHMDADIMRIFQFAGVADRIEPMTRATTGGVHLGMDG